MSIIIIPILKMRRLRHGDLVSCLSNWQSCDSNAGLLALRSALSVTPLAGLYGRLLHLVHCVVCGCWYWIHPLEKQLDSAPLKAPHLTLRSATGARSPHGSNTEGL